MLYTRKGDKGTTKTFYCDQRISKSSLVAEALGALDETNSFLGLCKILSEEEKLKLSGGGSFAKEVHNMQKNLFIVQAEVAGSKMMISKEKIDEIEKIIDDIEKELPPIKNFFIAGGTNLAVYFDIARTIARRAERRVVAVQEEGLISIGEETLAYLNRISSLLYALTRLANFKHNVSEEKPDYK